MSIRSPRAAPAGDDAPLERIVLIGFMGSGKSAVGAALAGATGWRHLDLDALVETEAGHPIGAIFAAEGEAGFRRREAMATERSAAERPAVISTGGGWVLDAANPARLAPCAFVWLRAALDTALRRAAADGDTRPLLAGADAHLRAARLLAEREPLYADLAHQVVDTDHISPAEAAAQILRQFSARLVPA